MNRNGARQHRQSKWHRAPNGRGALHGFTLVELMMGMIVTSIVLGALASFTIAVSDTWQVGDADQAMQLGSNRALLWAQQEIRSSRYIGFARASGQYPSPNNSAAVIFWENDRNNDGKLQLGEIGMLEFSGGALLLYQRVDDSAMTSAMVGEASVTIPTSQFFQATASHSAPEQLKAIDLFASPKTLSKSLTQCQFNVTSATSSSPQVLQILASFSSGGKTLERYETAAIRASLTPGN